MKTLLYRKSLIGEKQFTGSENKTYKQHQDFKWKNCQQAMTSLPCNLPDVCKLMVDHNTQRHREQEIAQ